MTNKETIERNIGLTFDFVNHLIDNPITLNKLPNDLKIDFIEKDFPNVEKIQQEKGSKSNRKYIRVRNSFEFSK